jgi:hypothetical protein
MKRQSIVGLVRDRRSGNPIAGARVRAYERDPYVDDLVGETMTGRDGRFAIGGDDDAFAEFVDDAPDVIVEVVLPGRAAHVERRDLRWVAGTLLPLLPIEVPGGSNGKPHEHEHESGHGHEHPHEHGHEHPHEHDDDRVHCGWCGHSHGRTDPCEHAKPPERCRDIYLKIEKIPGYSPVAPDDAEHHKHRRDCMRNPTHEDTNIPHAEVEQRKLDAVVYREYLDAAYTIPNTAPLVSADVNEPRFDRRVPGAVLYAEPGERLFIHVLNADDAPHSFHLHGLVYGIDSDGSWPFGVADADGRRSDAICPGTSGATPSTRPRRPWARGRSTTTTPTSTTT